MNAKTISICGKQVELLYCAATETGYESLSGQSCEIFIPEITKDETGKIIDTKMLATTRDYIQLAVAAIIAAYASKGQDEPVTADDILYHATSHEVTQLITAVIELRNAWYQVSSVVKPEENEEDKHENKDDEDTSKNA